MNLLCILTTWVAMNSVGILIGARLPEAAGLHIAATIALAGLLAKSVNGSGARHAAVTAAVIAVVAVGLPFRSVVLVASLAGIAVGSAHTAAWRARRNDVGVES